MNLRLILVCIVFTQSVFCQSLSQKISLAFGGFEKDPQLKYGLASLTVLNAQTGEIVFSRNGGTGLAPASTLKTVISASAFYLLGKDFRWETTLGYSGTISAGTLKGDLILKGGGDPTLGSSRYEQSKPERLLNRWIRAIKEAGIKRIEGRIVVDDQLFGTQITPMGWIWQDIGNYYGAGATSASWRENEFGLRFKAGSRPGDPVTFLGSEPAIPGLKIISEVTTGTYGSGDNVYAYSAPYSNVMYVRGTYGIDLNKAIKVAIPDPALQLALDFKAKIVSAAIEHSGPVTTTRILSTEGEASLEFIKQLDLYSSPALSQVVYWLNQKSLNLYAENLLKTLSLKQGKSGTFEDGVKAIQEFWSRKAGIEPNSLDILDGSGLSPENRVTTTSIAKILLASRKEPWFDSFYESLPLYNNMKMKSGSIRNALCYAGYEKTASGIPVVFSFITNNYNGSTSAIKQKMFKVLDTLK